MRDGKVISRSGGGVVGRGIGTLGGGGGVVVVEEEEGELISALLPDRGKYWSTGLQGECPQDLWDFFI